MSTGSSMSDSTSEKESEATARERCGACGHTRAVHFPDWCTGCSYEQRRGMAPRLGMWRHVFEKQEV